MTGINPMDVHRIYMKEGSLCFISVKVFVCRLYVHPSLALLIFDDLDIENIFRTITFKLIRQVLNKNNIMFKQGCKFSDFFLISDF